jgi:hypothetical protein
MRRIVGVMPRGFWFPDPSVRVWLSQPMRPNSRAGNYVLIGRRAVHLPAGVRRQQLHELVEADAFAPGRLECSRDPARSAAHAR